MRRHRISAGDRRLRIGLAIVLAITSWTLGCARDQDEGKADVLGQDTTLARNLAMANTPGAEGMSEEELAALVSNQPPLPSWVAVATQLDRNPPRQASPAPVSTQGTDQAEVAAESRDRDATGSSRSVTRDSLSDSRAVRDTGAGRIVAAIVPAESAATVAGETTAGPAPASRRVIATTRTACESPALEDQRACLVRMLAQHDAPVNSAYAARIEQLRGDAGARPGDADPSAVRELREVQIRWLVFRDRECRRRTAATTGTLWAPARADCLGLFSTARAWELRQA